jgi:hypothetical protein
MWGVSFQGKEIAQNNAEGKTEAMTSLTNQTVAAVCSNVDLAPLQSSTDTSDMDANQGTPHETIEEFMLAFEKESAQQSQGSGRVEFIH